MNNLFKNLFFFILLISCTSPKSLFKNETCVVYISSSHLTSSPFYNDSISLIERKEEFISLHFQQSLYASLLVQYPFDFKKNLSKSLNNKFRKSNLVDKRRGSQCFEVTFITDILTLLPPSNCKLSLDIDSINFGCKADSIYTFYKVSIPCNYIFDCFDFETKKQIQRAFPSILYDIDICSQSYVIALKKTSKLDLSSYVPQSNVPQENDILFLSKEFLQYESSISYLNNYLIDQMQDDPLLKFQSFIKLFYFNYEPYHIRYLKESRSKLYFNFYSQKLEKVIKISILKKYPYTTNFKIIEAD